MTLFARFQPKPGNPLSEGPDSALEGMRCAGQGQRTVTLSNHLLQRCDLGRLLLEMKVSSHSAFDDPAAASDTGNVAGEESITLSLDAFPDSISPEGLGILDAWARAEAEAEEETPLTAMEFNSGCFGAPQLPHAPSAAGGTEGRDQEHSSFTNHHNSKSSSRRKKRLSEFVVAYAEAPVHLAARAADFMGCEGFLELFTQLQVLRVSMAGGGVLGQLAGMEAERRRKGEQEGERERRKQERAQGLRRRRWWWERVLRDWGERPGQQPREAGCWELPRTPNGHQQGNAGGGDDATEVIAISGMLPKLSNFSKEAIQTHLPLLLDDSPLSDSSLNEDDGMDFEATATGASSSSSPLASRPPGPWSPARHDVPVHWVEAVVALLPHTDLLPYQITSTQHLRYLLAASGLVAACYAEHRVEKPLVVRQGKELYVGLDLMALPEAVRQGYVAVGVEVEAEGHDQGYTYSPEYEGTYNNCGTWNELVVVRVGGDRGRGGSQHEPMVVPVREGEPGRLFTNLHGVRKWQQHSARLGPTSQVVQDLNTHVFVAPGGGAAGQQQQQVGPAAAGEPLGNRQRVQKEKAEEEEDHQDEGEGDWWERVWWEGEGKGQEEDGLLDNGADAGECPLMITNDGMADLRFFWGPDPPPHARLYGEPDVLGVRHPLPRHKGPTGGPPRLQLRLLQCADRPEDGDDATRWRHYMQSGSVTLHLRARRA